MAAFFCARSPVSGLITETIKLPALIFDNSNPPLISVITKPADSRG